MLGHEIADTDKKVKSRPAALVARRQLFTFSRYVICDARYAGCLAYIS